MVASGYTERIREARPRLSKSFKRLADYILDSYIQAALMTASELAHQVNVDAATVVRFAQALEYSGFPEMQDEIKDRVLEELHLDPQKESTPESLADSVDLSLQEFAQSLERTRRLLDMKAMEQIVKQLQIAEKVLVLAKNNFRAIGSYFAQELGKFGMLASFIALEEDELAESIAAGGEKDFILVIDMEGTSALMGAAVVQANSFGLTSGALVGGASFESARKADITIEVHARQKGESEFLLLAAILESLLELLKRINQEEQTAYEARVKKARSRFSKLS